MSTLSSSRYWPAPMATDSSGLSAVRTAIPVSALKRASRPQRRAPPPVSAAPCNMMSAASSGGVLSKVALRASTMAVTGSSMA